MTTTYNTLIKNLTDVNKEILELICIAKNTSELPNPGFSDWDSVCMNIKTELQKNTVRIAIVGAIKSGKSTFTNSILQKDYLKRGAGVLTSIVTRIRNGSLDQATLFLKNWDEINNEIKQALLFIPSCDKSFDKNELDIRRSKDRNNLKLALSNIGPDQLITNNVRNTNNVVISSYLKGYNQMQEYVDNKNVAIKLNKEDFLLHRNFVSNDNLAIYLKDVLLEIEGTKLGKNVEIADCQGSDSPNPLHLSMIQDYLNIAHLIVYIISSRIGIRQADLKFLSIIKRMGLLNNIIFIVNSDLNEHESLKNLKTTIANIEDNICLVHQSVYKIFTFSALNNLERLTDNIKDTKIPIIDNNRTKIVDFSTKEYSRFDNFFKNKINCDRYFLLTNNNIQKLVIISKHMENWIKFNQDILKRNTDTAEKIIRDMIISRSELLSLKTTIYGSILGGIEQIKKDLFIDIERFFGDKNTGLTKDLIQFIRNWHFNLNNSCKIKTDDLSKNVYSIFQEFKQDLENYIAETINPDIIRFLQEQEIKLIQYLESLSAPYFSMFRNALEKHNTKINQLDLSLKNNYKPVNIMDNLNLIRNHTRMAPLLFNAIQYPTKIKTKAIFHFGFGKITEYVLNFLGVVKSHRKNPGAIALKKTTSNIKKETEISVAFHLKNYKENIKFQHITHIANLLVDILKEQISNHLSINTMELDELGNLIKSKNQKKKEILKSLSCMAKKSENINKTIKEIKEVANKSRKENN